MKALKFGTTICSECCVRYFAHYFTDTQIKNWHVDLHHPLKVLTVEQHTITAEEVITVVRKAGYEIEELYDTSELLDKASLSFTF